MRRWFYNLMTDQDRCPCLYPLKALLWLLSHVYGAALYVRDISYALGLAKETAIPGAKVISVGNLTTGGTGKTPMAIKLALLLKDKGKKVAVLLRGYGRDEYMMLKGALGDIPVLKGKDRVKNAKEAVEKYKSYTLILDDGFQYRKLKKDLNILLLDSRNPFGNGRLLPRGILRDRPANAKHADIIVLTKTGPGAPAAEEEIAKIAPGIQVLRALHTPLSIRDILKDEELPLDFLKGKRIASLSAIGDPRYFNELLEGLGAERILEFEFLDHHEYTQKELDEAALLCKNNNVDTVLTTEKDAVKLSEGLTMDNALRVLSLKIKMDLKENEPELTDRLLRIYTS